MLPEIKLNISYLWQEFNDEIKRLNHLKGIIDQQNGGDQIALTPHKTQGIKTSELSEQELQMLRQYLLHILQFGTPDERLKILAGIKSKFELRDRKLQLL